MVHTLQQRFHARLEINGKIIDMIGKKQIISFLRREIIPDPNHSTIYQQSSNIVYKQSVSPSRAPNHTRWAPSWIITAAREVRVNNQFW